MVREKVGQISESEKNMVLRLYERIIALNEVAMTLDNEFLKPEERNELRKKIDVELPRSQKELDEWWQQKSKENKWKSNENGSWTIDFKTNEIFLEY